MPTPSTLFCPACTRASSALRTWNPPDTSCPRCGHALAEIPVTWIAQLADAVGQPPPEAPASPADTPIHGRVRWAPTGGRSRATRLELIVGTRDGGDRLPAHRGSCTLSLNGPDGHEFSVRALVGRTARNPAYFRDRVRSTNRDGSILSLAELLAELRYDAGDPLVLEPQPERHAFVIRPNPRRTVAPAHRGRKELDQEEALAVPELHFGSGFDGVEDARVSLGGYEAGAWQGRRNLDLDREGYALLAHSIPTATDDLVRALAFVGRFYTGVREALLDGGFDGEARSIAGRLQSRRSEWERALRSLRSLREAAPSLADVVTLLHPFHGDRTWLVWGTKFLHFARPDVFPILDPAVERALGLRRTTQSAHYYVGFCRAFRRLLIDSEPVLAVLRAETSDREVPDLKLLDRVLWVIGRRRKRSTAHAQRSAE